MKTVATLIFMAMADVPFVDIKAEIDKFVHEPCIKYILSKNYWESNDEMSDEDKYWAAKFMLASARNLMFQTALDHGFVQLDRQERYLLYFDMLVVCENDIDRREAND